MRFLIHYTGDVHQPLHATARVDTEFPAGDRGGNSFPLKSKDGAKNLHAAWDSVVYADANDFDLPLTDASWSTIGQTAATFVETYPVSDVKDLASIDPAVWAQDSFQAGETFVYKNIAESQPLPAEYVNEAQKIAQKQIVIGGFRLAHILMDIYGTKTDLFL
jgi:hypothetical protein